MDLEVRPRSEPRSFRDISLSAMHFSHSDKNFQMSLAFSNKNIETEKAPDPKMVHLPFKGYYGEDARSANENASQKTVVRPKTPVNQDWGYSPLYQMILQQYEA